MMEMRINLHLYGEEAQNPGPAPYVQHRLPFEEVAAAQHGLAVGASADRVLLQKINNKTLFERISNSKPTSIVLCIAALE